MVALVKLLVAIIKIMISLNKFGLLDEVISGLQSLIPTEDNAGTDADAAV